VTPFSFPFDLDALTLDFATNFACGTLAAEPRFL
jgi:hypothetical protein